MGDQPAVGIQGSSERLRENKVATFGSGAFIGTLGGLIGLGGAEFRLPILISLFGYAALEAVILNKAISLVVVAFALQWGLGIVINGWTPVDGSYPERAYLVAFGLSLAVQCTGLVLCLSFKPWQLERAASP